MRFALFYNRANGKAIETTAPLREVVRRIEAEVKGAVGIALVGRRAPVVAAISNVVRRRPETIARGGKEDRLAISLTRYFIAVMATLCRPCPSTLVYEFLALCPGRQSP